MKKIELLEEIHKHSVSGSVSRAEIITAFETGQQSTHSVIKKSKLFFYTCAAIVFLGGYFLIRSHWQELTFLAQFLVTLGLGLASYGIAAYCHQTKSFKDFVDPLFIFSGILLSMGITVVFSQSSQVLNIGALASLASCISLTLFLASYFLFEREVFVLLSIGASTWLFYAFTSYLLSGTSSAYVSHLREYKFLFIGLSYLCLGFWFGDKMSKTKHARFTPWLYAIGCFLLLLAVLFITGIGQTQNKGGEVLYAFILLGFYIASVRLKVLSFTVLASLFLFFFILKLGYEYSAHISLSKALLFSGIVLAGCGYLSFYLNKRFLSAKKTW